MFGHVRGDDVADEIGGRDRGGGWVLVQAHKRLGRLHKLTEVSKRSKIPAVGYFEKRAANRFRNRTKR
jgi:hypothetical protein